jgi:nucleoside 2-deoxyribosyltransferase
MKIIYTACPLTHSSDQYKQNFEQFKNQLRKHYKVLDFQGVVAGTTRDVFRKDTQNVVDCDLLLAEVSIPSLGVGYEIGMAMHLNKPVLAVAEENAKVTRLIQGIEHPNYQFIRYKNLSDLVLDIKKALGE